MDGADTQVQRLQEAVDQRERAAERYVREAQSMLEAGQFGAACQAAARARSANPKAALLPAVEGAILSRFIEQLSRMVRDGRPDLAAELAGQLGGVGRGRIERLEWERTLEDLRAACEAVSRADWPAARWTVLRLKARLPDVEWIAQAAEHLAQIEELITTVQAGPLGGPHGMRGPGRVAMAGPGASAAGLRRQAADDSTALLHPAEVASLMAGPMAAAPAAPRLRLLLDGGGSYLLLRQDRITIGRGPGYRPDGGCLRHSRGDRAGR